MSALLTLAAALGCGLIAGTFFAFSSFVMPALGRLAPAEGIRAMQSINVVVLNPVFLGVFLGAGVACALLAFVAPWTWSRPGAALRLAGGLVYLIGTIGVTRVCNIPRNDAIAALDPSSVEAGAAWARYLSTWTAWNHVRTVAALAAAALFTLALARDWAQR
jgi:uncharacterized membrane protein